MKSICDEFGDQDGVLYQTSCAVLYVEQEYRTQARRSGLYPKLEKIVEKAAFASEKEAEKFALEKAAKIEVANRGLDEHHPEIVFNESAAITPEPDHFVDNSAGKQS